MLGVGRSVCEVGLEVGEGKFLWIGGPVTGA